MGVNLFQYKTNVTNVMLLGRKHCHDLNDTTHCEWLYNNLEKR